MNAFNLQTHLGAFLFTENHFRLKGLVGFVELAILEAYTDASGKDENLTDRILTVNGCLGMPVKWAAFDIEWQDYLKSVGFKRHEKSRKYVFHTAPFWADKCKYMPQNLTFKDKKGIYRQLVEIVCKYRVCVFGYAVSLSAFRRIEVDFPHVRRFIFGKPGTFLVNLCIESNHNWAKHNGYETSIGYTLDKGDEFLTQLERQFLRATKESGGKDMIVSGLRFASSAEYSPVQAADIVAWECRKYWSDRIVHPIRSLAPRLPPSYELTRLINNIDTIRLYEYKDIKEELIEYWRNKYLTPEEEAKMIGKEKDFSSIEEFIRHTLIYMKEKFDKDKLAEREKDRAKREAKRKL